MLPAIDFDNELRTKAGKIDNKLVDRSLAAKVITHRTQFTQPHP